MTEPPHAVDHARERVGEARGAADRQRELRHVGENERKHDARAGHAFGRDDVHVGGEQRADAVVVEVLAHDAEQIVLRMREEFLGLRSRQAILELVDRKRGVEGERGEQRAHLAGIEAMQLAERLGVPSREAGQRPAGFLEILVEDDAGAVAECRSLLNERLDEGEAEPMQLEVADQRRMAQPHEEVGMQVEAISRQGRLVGRAAAADARVAFDHADLEAGPRQIGRKREPVVTGSDDDAVVTVHLLLRRA